MIGLTIHPIDPATGRQQISRGDHVLGCVQVTRGAGSPTTWASFALDPKAQDGLVLIGVFGGRQSKHKALGRLLDYTRARAFLTSCVVMPEKEWRL